MYFDDAEEKKLFEDIQFKRKTAFVDDDDVLTVEIKSFSKVSERVEVEDRGVQINIQNEPVSSSAQTRSKKSKEVQTEDDDSQTELNKSKIDIGRMTKLLDRRGHLIENALSENIHTTAFDNYDVDWTSGSSSITNPFTLVNKQLLKEEELQVTGVEWNSSGSTIICAYGRLDHESVCTHKSALCSWNIDRLKLDVNKPDVSIETGCCISAIGAHPEYPAIVAAGFFNGEIHVYDIRQNDPLVATVTEKKELHRDEISVLKWIKDPKSAKKKFILMSGSKDGKILFWNALPSKNQLKLVDGFSMLVDNMARTQFRSVEMAVSSIALNKENKETFMVGCESGGLFKCSFIGKELPNTSQARRLNEDFPIELKSPVEVLYDPQYGPIYSMSHSPFHRNLLLTCGTDSEIKLYSLLQTGSLMNFCPENGYLYSVEWSPSRPCVFACGTHNGNILIYDLNAFGSKFCQTNRASEYPIYTISFNQRRADFLASGDKAGVVKIWKLSQSLTKFDPSELNRLNDISEKPFKNG